MSPSNLLVVAALAAVAGAAGCSHHVGDACNVNVDCSALGDRFCDSASPGGYCTIEGCDVRSDDNGNLVDSCPSEAVCVRFFSQIACEPCDPVVELDPTREAEHQCGHDERCLCDFSDPANPATCLAMSIIEGAGVSCPQTTAAGTPAFGHCAPVSSERRWCVESCDNDNDCRGGYACRQTGTRGAEAVPRRLVPVNTASGGTVLVPTGDTATFCAPTGRPG